MSSQPAKKAKIAEGYNQSNFDSSNGYEGDSSTSKTQSKDTTKTNSNSIEHKLRRNWGTQVTQHTHQNTMPKKSSCSEKALNVEKSEGDNGRGNLVTQRWMQQTVQEEVYNNVGWYTEMPDNGEGSGNQEAEEPASIMQCFDAADWET